MNPLPTSKAESFNSLVRAGTLIVLMLTVCFAYLWQLMKGGSVGTLEGAILSLTGSAFVWWFKSRDDKPEAKPDTPPTNGGVAP